MAEKVEKNSLSSVLDAKNIHLVKVETVVKFRDESNTKNESEKERLERISEIYLAKLGNREDRREKNEELRKKDKMLSKRQQKKTAKKSRKRKKAEKKQRANKEVSQNDDHDVHKPYEAFLEIEVADDKKERGKFPSCFGFIMAWFEKRKEKRLLKKIDEDPHKLCVSSSDILIEIPNAPRANVADILTGNGLKEDVLEIDDVEIISY
ncbi:nucleolar protein 58-like [Ruditapes philippinarum]|uniref:nucleolar protein 58-like n=1 Tax=Ruditapes philippinarum TaxID=129788 RepID=UPI00295BDE94|nr:nucleolar protein 58-like [Ruditapes philippinarum]XP_060583655.1 nucleolar protein 58-like [Ruditapes philippinarum]